jgi:hypothetical protein
MAVTRRTEVPSHPFPECLWNLSGSRRALHWAGFGGAGGQRPFKEHGPGSRAGNKSPGVGCRDVQRHRSSSTVKFIACPRAGEIRAAPSSRLGVNCSPGRSGRSAASRSRTRTSGFSARAAVKKCSAPNHRVFLGDCTLQTRAPRMSRGRCSAPTRQLSRVTDRVVLRWHGALSQKTPGWREYTGCVPGPQSVRL